jgi:ribonuclease HII
MKKSALETKLLKTHSIIVGVDECGMGCVAGPLVAGAVALDYSKLPSGIKDSKKLTEKSRERLFEEIKKACFVYATGVVDVDELNQISNISVAGYLARERAVLQATYKLMALRRVPHYIIIDGFPFKGVDSDEERTKYELISYSKLMERICPQVPSEGIIGADGEIVSVAAASIIAKVFRDQYMKDIDGYHPEFNFKQHKGYPTKAHLDAIKKHGVSHVHRTWMKGVADVTKKYTPVEINDDIMQGAVRIVSSFGKRRDNA